MFGSSLHPVVWRRAHGLFTLFVFVSLYWCPSHIVLCFCFVFLRLVCTICYQFLWTVHLLWPLRFSFYLHLLKGCQTLKPHIHLGSHENQLFRRIFKNTSGVMVSVFAVSPEDREFELRSDQPKIIKNVFYCFSTKHATILIKGKYILVSNQDNRGATCLIVECYLSELAL